MQTIKSLRQDILRFEKLLAAASADLSERGGVIQTANGESANPSLRVFSQSQLALGRLRKMLKLRLAEVAAIRAERKKARQNDAYNL